jgi:hypothetical protein
MPQCDQAHGHGAGLLEEQDLMGQPNTVVWYPNGKYAVFPRQVSPPRALRNAAVLSANRTLACSAALASPSDDELLLQP